MWALRRSDGYMVTESNETSYLDTCPKSLKTAIISITLDTKSGVLRFNKGPAISSHHLIGDGITAGVLLSKAGDEVLLLKN